MSARSCAALRASPPRSGCGGRSSCGSATVRAPACTSCTSRTATSSYEERSAPEADARIEGPERAWVEAFGLDASRTELEISGDAAVAERLLDFLAAVAVRAAAVA